MEGVEWYQNIFPERPEKVPGQGPTDGGIGLPYNSQHHDDTSTDVGECQDPPKGGSPDYVANAKERYKKVRSSSE